MGQGFSGGNAGDYFGSAVLSKISMTLSEDGNTLVISAALSLWNGAGC